jgi:glycosyltransferase involved in cell wall biosynthesis
MLVSVITPTRNRASTFLRETIESVALQVLPDWIEVEHIIADDCSQADEVDVLQELAKKYSHIEVVLRKESGGVSAARNSAFRASMGEIIIDLDDDDVLPQTSIVDRVTHLMHSDAMWSCGDMLKLDEQLQYKMGFDLIRRNNYPRTGLQALQGFLDGSLYAWAGTRTYRREALLEAGPWDESFPVAEDLEHWMRLAAVVAEPAWCERYLVLYREKENSLGINALRDGDMKKYGDLARKRWSNYIPGNPLPDGVPKW